jgi:formate-dependent nitrite reductase membrane component NrfD
VIVRYGKSADPVRTDGRDIDPEVGALLGEAAGQESFGSRDKHIEHIAETWQQLPEPRRNDPTYYDRPLLKAPVWEWAIPLYYYVGGLTGASLALGAAAQLVHSERVTERSLFIGVTGAAVSGVLLIWDLGRPSRFLNMLRVFRPTSPMNVGAWILAKTGAASTVALLCRGSSFGKFCGISSGVLGTGLATYTGVLVSNSAIPLWQESRRVLPILFGGSAMASAGCLALMLSDHSEETSIARAFGVTGQVIELTAAIAMERQVSTIPRVGRPLKIGLSGAMWRTAAVLTAGSIIVGVLPGKSRNKRIAAGVLGTLGSLLMRFAVHHGGVASARDARASFHLQRADKNETAKNIEADSALPR